MTASAAFELDPGTGTYGPSPQEVSAAGATVRCRLLSVVGINGSQIAWTCTGTSGAAFAAPTIALSGNPTGQIAEFAFPAGAGNASIIECRVNGGPDVTGDAGTSSSGKFYSVFANGLEPVSLNEQFESSATHATVEIVNAAIAGSGGSGSSTVAPLSTALFVDAGTLVDPGDQDGSIGAPFASPQGALDAPFVNREIIWLAPGNYDDALTIADHDGFVSLRGMDQLPGTVNLTGIDAQGGTPLYLSLQDVVLTDAVDGSATVMWGFRVAFGGGIDLDGDVILEDCLLASVDCSMLSLAAKSSRIGVTTIRIADTYSQLQRCSFTTNTNIIFENDPGELEVDADTWAEMQNANVTWENASITLMTGRPNEISGTTYTLSTTDLGRTHHCTHAAGCEITIPQASTLRVPHGARASFVQRGAGRVSFVGAGSLVVNAPSSARTEQVGATAHIEWIADNDVQLSGQLDPFGSADVTFPTTAGDADATAFTVPASPSGAGRFVLERVIVRLTTAIVGSGTVQVRVGTSAGGDQIVTDQAVSSSNTVGEVLGGHALASLGTSMVAANGYSAILDAGATVQIRATTTGTLSAGAARLYVFGNWLP